MFGGVAFGDGVFHLHELVFHRGLVEADLGFQLGNAGVEGGGLLGEGRFLAHERAVAADGREEVFN